MFWFLIAIWQGYGQLCNIIWCLFFHRYNGNRYFFSRCSNRWLGESSTKPCNNEKESFPHFHLLLLSHGIHFSVAPTMLSCFIIFPGPVFAWGIQHVAVSIARRQLLRNPAPTHSAPKLLPWEWHDLISSRQSWPREIRAWHRILGPSCWRGPQESCFTPTLLQLAGQ